MIKKYYDSDCNLSILDGKTVAVIGFGSQGHAHSENLAESGVNVVVGLRANSAHAKKAQAFADTHPNFKVMEVEDAAKAADVVMMLVPDELAADIYNTQVAPHMKEGDVLCFAHGFNIHFNLIQPQKDIDVIMIAPKGPGHTVRTQYLEGKGVPSLIAVHQDYSGRAKDVALAYASGIGAGRAGILETSFREETETDLFGEQAVLAGGGEPQQRTVALVGLGEVLGAVDGSIVPAVLGDVQIVIIHSQIEGGGEGGISQLGRTHDAAAQLLVSLGHGVASFLAQSVAGGLGIQSVQLAVHGGGAHGNIFAVGIQRFSAGEGNACKARHDHHGRQNHG